MRLYLKGKQNENVMSNKLFFISSIYVIVCCVDALRKGLTLIDT